MLCLAEPTNPLAPSNRKNRKILSKRPTLTQAFFMSKGNKFPKRNISVPHAQNSEK